MAILKVKNGSKIKIYFILNFFMLKIFVLVKKPVTYLSELVTE